MNAKNIITTTSNISKRTRQPIQLTSLALICCALASLPKTGRAAEPLYTTTTTQTGSPGTNWASSVIWYSNGTGTATAPAAGNTYEAQSNGTGLGGGNATTLLRPPYSAGTPNIAVFPGDSLILDTNTQMRLKALSTSGTSPEGLNYEVPTNSFPGANGLIGLVLNGGCLNVGDTGDASTILGTVQAFPGTLSYLDPGNTLAGDGVKRGLIIAAQLSGSGALALLNGNVTVPQLVSGTSNTFSGGWIIKAGWLQGAGDGTEGGYNSLGTNTACTFMVDPDWGPPPIFAASAVFNNGPAVLDMGSAALANCGGGLILTNGGGLYLHGNVVFSAVTVEGNVLAAGTYSYATLAALYPNNFQTTNFPTGSGTLTVQPYGAPPAPAVVPVITQAPIARTVYPGGTAPFSIEASGTPPLFYQWMVNGVNLPGATDAALIITNAGPASAASYSVGVTNSAGGAVSAGAALTLTTPAAGSYEAAVLASGPIAYWRLNEKNGDTAYDYQGANDGFYSSVTLGQPGYSPLDTDTSAGFDPTQPSAVIVSNSAPFDFSGLTPTFSCEVWGSFTNLSGVERLFSNRAPGWGFGVDTASDLRFTTFTVQDFNQALPTPLQAGTWYHIVGVSEGGNFSFYLNGQLVGTIAYAGALLPSTAPFYLGGNPNQTGGAEAVAGDLAEAAFYDQALTAEQILEHYSAGLLGTHTAPFIVQQPASQTVPVGASPAFSVLAQGSVPLSFQWSKAGVPITGATNSSLILSNVPYAEAGTFSVTITNAAGQTNSAAAALTVLPVPTFANLTNALVLHLTFDGNTADTSGRQNNASAIGTPTFVPGRLNQAIALSTVQNASYNYLTVSDNNGDLSFTVTNSFTVALWLNFTTGFNDLPIIGNAVNSTYQTGWVLTEDVGKFEWSAVGSDTGSVIANPVGGPLINDGNWHHLAVVFDRSASNAVSYVDGQWIDTRSIASLGSLITGNALTIGQDPTGTYGVGGTFGLDDLGIWRRALSGYEILSIYTAAQNAAESFDVYGPVRLSIAMVAGQHLLAWQAGTLESADQLNGAQTVWTPVPGAAPPIYTLPATAAQKFYRGHVR
ncbi:MAG TPA: LamG-like jellyroll fold domain-containing protein [Dongiaceae bacterium]|nr:LamG-like jellyroll fold domain-containing protein [Dongiaceae bacterium]